MCYHRSPAGMDALVKGAEANLTIKREGEEGFLVPSSQHSVPRIENLMAVSLGNLP